MRRRPHWAIDPSDHRSGTRRGPEKLGLQRQRSRIYVDFTMNEKYRELQLVDMKERRDLYIHTRRLPKRAPLVLESEYHERLVVRAAPRDPCAEKIRVREKVHRHRPAMAVPHHANTVAIHAPELNRLVTATLAPAMSCSMYVS